MWPPNSFGLVDRGALFGIRNQDRRELSGLAHRAPRISTNADPESAK